jgi:hypothetical protein
MEMSLVSIGVEKENMVMKGKMGVWDSKIIVTPEEALRMAGMMLKPAVILYIFKLPFLFFKKKK